MQGNARSLGYPSRLYVAAGDLVLRRGGVLSLSKVIGRKALVFDRHSPLVGIDAGTLKEKLLNAVIHDAVSKATFVFVGARK